MLVPTGQIERPLKGAATARRPGFESRTKVELAVEVLVGVLHVAARVGGESVRVALTFHMRGTLFEFHITGAFRRLREALVLLEDEVRNVHVRRIPEIQ